VEVGFLETRPIGDNPAALQRTAGEEGGGRGAVVGAVVAVDVRGAAEFGDERDDGVGPCCVVVAGGASGCTDIVFPMPAFAIPAFSASFCAASRR
jgi:hypothetical protein